jgi:Gpi18-like mannosyltransferase
MSRYFKAVIIISIVFRITLAPLTHHSDTIDNLNWGRELVENTMPGFYQRDTADAGPPNYPPGYFLISYTNQRVYKCVEDVLWFVNDNVGVFPSNLYLWFESMDGNIFFNKLPPIFADLVIAILLYKLLISLGKIKRAGLVSALYLLLPPSWYISSVWGQTDSLYILPLLGAVYCLVRKKYFVATVLYTLSLLIKPIGIFIAPMFGYFYIRNLKATKLIQNVTLSLLTLVITTAPFLEKFGPIQIFELFKNNVWEVTNYVTANAFNIWSVIFGFNPVLDNTVIFGLQVKTWGFLVFTIMTVLVLTKSKLKVNKSLLLALTILTLGAFLFLTKMHERYYYLAYVFILISYGLDKSLKNAMLIATVVFTANLYHFWWQPQIGLVINALSLQFVEITLSAVNFYVFYIVARRFLTASKRS